MDAHERALLTYRALEKRKQKKRDEEKRRIMDTNSIGWDGYTKFRNRELKKYYR